MVEMRPGTRRSPELKLGELEIYYLYVGGGPSICKVFDLFIALESRIPTNLSL